MLAITFCKIKFTEFRSDERRKVKLYIILTKIKKLNLLHYNIFPGFRTCPLFTDVKYVYLSFGAADHEDDAYSYGGIYIEETYICHLAIFISVTLIIFFLITKIFFYIYNI